MNKILLGIALVAILVVAFGTAGYVYAQSPTPGTPAQGFGMGGGRGPRGGGMMGNRGAGNQDGIMHDEMVAAFAEKLGMTAADLEKRIAAGETMAQIADSKGITADQFTAMMTEARSQAIDQAVKNGTLTQEQADWMKQRSAGMGAGRGRGPGQGQFNNADCPYADDNS
jgi:Spy/CpxP family protein refolding chaperone